jgi:hypothetical protein
MDGSAARRLNPVLQFQLRCCNGEPLKGKIQVRLYNFRDCMCDPDAMGWEITPASLQLSKKAEKDGSYRQT